MWEGVGVCSYLLVSFWFTRIAANQSSMSAFLTNRVGDCLLTVGMFAILWSFGKNKQMFKYLNNMKRKKYSNYSHNSFIAPYLAGLIEGDGHIAIHDKNSKTKKFRPKIIIVFHKNDKPLAEKLCALLKMGKVIPKKGGHVIFQILAKEEVLKIINLINGQMRTPKIEALHRAINWINDNDNLSIPCLGRDLSPIYSNSWLSGFTDADGNFSITITDTKKKDKITGKRVQTFFRIELTHNYPKLVSDTLGGNSYFNILTKISAYLNVNLYTRTRYVKDKVYYSFMVIAHNYKSHDIVREYFDRFPLYSSKYLAYKDWCKVQDIHRGKSLIKEDLDKIKEIKSQFNSKRKLFDFSHLDYLTF